MKLDLTNKKVVILGLGKSNISAVRLLNRLNSKEIFVSETNPDNEYIPELKSSGIFYETGDHTDACIKNTDLIIKSPGIPMHSGILNKAVKLNIPVWSELEFAYRLINPNKIIGITGTNGKTTTTTLTGKICSNAGYKTVICGNIGSPLSDFVDKIDAKTIVVIEISSYQLETIDTFKPHISCILNITPDHLEHHLNMDEYIKSKSRIFSNQDKSGYCVYNHDDSLTRELILKNRQKYPVKFVPFSISSELEEGIYYNKGNFIMNLNTHIKSEYSINLQIPGNHNIENAMATIAISALLNIKIDIIKKTIESFQGVEHRIEFVRELNGIKYFNDSKSTNVDSTYVALNSFDNPVILIMGGRDKGAPYKPLSGLIRQKVKKLLLIGESTGKIYNELNSATEIIKCGTMENAVREAHQSGNPGDIVLLSPGCSSFDQFTNFEHRGKVFKDLVNSLV